MSKNIGKALSALTLVVAGTGALALAPSAIAEVSPNTEAVAQATSIQFPELSLANDIGIRPPTTGTHLHNHDNDYAQRVLNAGIHGASFDV